MAKTQGRGLLLALVAGITPFILVYSGALDSSGLLLQRLIAGGAALLGVVAIVLAIRDRRSRRDGLALTIAGIVVGAAGALWYAFITLLLGMNFGHGRPFRRQGRPVRARPRGARGWADEQRPELAGLDAATRERLAAAWTDDALAEHASIAAFSRLALDLMALGAPARLLEACTEAQRDEIAHARACFAMASAYAGRPLAASPMPEAALGETRPVAEAQRRRQLAIESLRDGCVDEQASADVAEASARRASDPAVRALLERLAADEARHAELAWHVVEHCLEEDPSLRGPLAAELEALATEARPAAGSDPGPLAAHGRLSTATIASLRAARAGKVVARGWALLG